MKLTRKSLSTLGALILLGFLVGTLIWEVAERVLGAVGVPLSLSVGPVGFDLYVVAFSMRVNPGSVLGIGAGVLLFRAV